MDLLKQFEQSILNGDKHLTEEELRTCIELARLHSFNKNERPRMYEQIQKRWGD